MLDEVDRIKVWCGLMRWYSNLRERVSLSKVELAVDATLMDVEEVTNG